MFTDKVSEADVLGFYFGINSIPCNIVSPFRNDNNPSLAFYSPDGHKINYIDFGDPKERGSFMTFFMKLWHLDYNATIDKIVKEVVMNNKKVTCKESSLKSLKHIRMRGKVSLRCKIREWKDYDIEYWESYGISLEWLKWAEVYPISHKFIIVDDKEMVFRADKYAYTFVERKDGRITYKFYQPFNKKGYKWQNNHDKSVLGLWTKMPDKGNAVCICSSVKDALCLMANIHIPCICLQGEGYPISKTAEKVLKQRFKNIYICLDNDTAGLEDANKLAESTGFTNIIIPQFEGGKDISDYYKLHGKEAFISLFKKLFNAAFSNN